MEPFGKEIMLQRALGTEHTPCQGTSYMCYSRSPIPSSPKAPEVVGIPTVVLISQTRLTGFDHFVIVSTVVSGKANLQSRACLLSSAGQLTDSPVTWIRTRLEQHTTLP